MAVLKSKLSGYYFKDFGEWTSNPLEALKFATEWIAREFMRRQPVDSVQVVEPEGTTCKLKPA